jgi:Glycosyltransferase family 87
MAIRSGTLEGSVHRAPQVRPSSDALAIGANIAIRAALVVGVLFALWTGPVFDSDARRFSALSGETGTPYRDYAVEYAPVELGVIQLIGSGDVRATAIRLVVTCFLLDLLAFAGMWSGWGRRIAIAYLWLGVPLLVLGYLRLWYLPVALAVWALALLRKRRPDVAGVVGALALFAKLWPIALAPALLAETRRRSFPFVLAGLVGGVGWLVLGGIGGVRQVMTFRSATGWEIESTVGTLVWVFGGGEPRFESGAARVGSSQGLAWMTGVLLVVLLSAVWWKALRSKEEDLLGVPSLAALCALLACSPIFSLQYAGWLTPWAAIASSDPRRVPIASAWAIVILTAGVRFALFEYTQEPLSAVMLLARNGLCVLVPVWFLFSGGHGRGTPKDSDRRASLTRSVSRQPAVSQPYVVAGSSRRRLLRKTVSRADTSHREPARDDRTGAPDGSS